MSERIGNSGGGENFITRINYSPQIKGAFCATAFGIPAVGLKFLETGPTGGKLGILQYRLFDMMSPLVYASSAKMVFGDNLKGELFYSLSVNFALEFGQALGINSGTFDWGDLVAFVVGASGWAAFEGTAKAMHDSGLTLPVYRLLGIQHKKFG